MKRSLPKILSRTSYVIAALVLVLFLDKNTSAYETHLIDVRNSAGPPLAVGADVPEFTVKDAEGGLFNSSQLPERCVLVIGNTSCPHFRDAMRDYNTAGNYRGVSSLYAVYLEVQRTEDKEAVEKAAKEFNGISICTDYENSVKWAFRCDYFPTTFLVENGKVVSKEVGYFDPLAAGDENE